LRIGDLSPAAEVNVEPYQSSTTVAPQDRPPASEHPQQRKEHLNSAVAFFGIGIAAAGALALLSWSERCFHQCYGSLTSSPRNSGRRRRPKSASPPALPVAKPPPDQSPGGSEQQPSTSELAGSVNRHDDQAAVRDAANRDSAIPPVARSATNPAISTSQARSDERVSRKREYAWWHALAARVAAAKKRFWRRHWQARGKLMAANGGSSHVVLGELSASSTNLRAT
jgi:hypothetical protein